MSEPQISTESVKYTLDGATVTAQRRDITGADGKVTSQWVFNVATILATTGAPFTPSQYVEKTAATEKERDQIGKDLVTLISSYQSNLDEAQRDFQASLSDYFPSPVVPVAPTLPVVTQ